MNMKRYEKYKPSGIDWIGEVPEHWEVMKLLYCLRQPICDGPHETPNLVENGVPFISIDSLNDTKEIDLTKASKFISEEDYRNYMKKAKLENGDVLFTKAATIGKTAIVGDEHFMVWSPLAILKSKGTRLSNLYLYYLLNCQRLVTSIVLSGSYNTQINVGMREMEKAYITVPPLAEQEAIAAYLDARCADIDKVVATQQKRIALLQELKQSEITQAVTRGLNLEARMKDSGVEWIGMVPEHWEVKKLKFVVSCNDDVLNDRTKDDQIIRYVEISDVNSIEGITNSTEYEFKKAPSRARRITKKDDVIVSTVRTYLKAIARIKEDDLIVSTGFAVLRAKNINPVFLAYSTLSELFIGTVISESVGVSYPAINSSDIINIKLPVPPSDEQVEIAEHLDRRCGEIDKQIGAVTKQIELLREYKQALITEVVTGKRKV